MAVVAIGEVAMQTSQAGFSNALRRSTRDLVHNFQDEFGKGMLAAFAVANVAAVKFTAQFDRSFNQIITLTDTTTKQVKEFRDAVADIGKAKGVGLDELADSLYFIRSAGIDAGEGLDGLKDRTEDTRLSMEALAASATLTGIGFGSVKDAAQSLTSLMIAYKDANLSASQAAGLLAGAVAAGKTEAEDFAKTIGDFIPVAAGLGVAAEDALSLASALTKTGTSASEAGTQVRAILSDLSDLRTTSDTKQINVLEKYGLSPDKIAEAIQGPGGLVAALEEIKRIVGEDDVALQLLFKNERAYRGILAAFQNDLKGVFDLVSTSGIGALLAKELRIEPTFAKQVDQIKASIQAFFIQLGDNLIPAIQGVVSGLGPFASGFALAAESVAKLVTLFSPLLNIINPVTVGIFGLYKSFTLFNNVVASSANRIFTALDNAAQQLATRGLQNASNSVAQLRLNMITGATSMAGLGIAAAGVTAALTIGLVVWQNYKQKQAETRAEIKELVAQLLEGKTAIEVFDGVVNDLFDDRGSRKILAEVGLTSDDIDTVDEARNQLSKLSKEIQTIFASGTGKSESITAEQAKRVYVLTEASKVLEEELKKTDQATKDFFTTLAGKGELQNVGVSVNQLTNAIKGNTTTLSQGSSGVSLLTNKIAALGTESERTTILQKLASVATKDNQNNIVALGTALQKSISTTDANSEALRKLIEQATGVSKAVADMSVDLQGIPKVSLDDFLGGDEVSNIKAYADSVRDVQSKTEALAEADDRVADARKGVSDARKKAAKEAEDEVRREKERGREIVAAKTAISKAEDNVEKAKEAVEKQREAAKQARYDAEVTAVRAVRDAKDKLVKAGEKVQDAIDNEGLALAKVKKAKEEVVKIDEKIADVANDYIKLEEKVADAREAASRATEELASKEFALEQALRNITVAEREVRDATFAVNGALLDQVKASEAVTQATLDKAKTETDYAKSQLDVVKSLDNVKKAQIEVANSGLKVKEAQNKVKDAQRAVLNVQREQANAYLDVAQKAGDLSEAQFKLNRIIRETGSDSKEAVDALKNLRDAQLDVRASALSVAEAQDKLNKARRALTAGNSDQSVAELRNQVEGAEIDLIRARNSVIDANNKVRFARNDIGNVAIDQQEKRKQGARDVLEAERAVIDQQFKAGEFAGKYVEAQIKVQEALNSVKEAELDRKDALRSVESALIDVLESNDNLAQADFNRKKSITAITEALLKQAEAELKVVQAREGIDDANNGVTVARNAAKESRQAVDNQREDVQKAVRNIAKVETEGLIEIEEKLDKLREERITALEAVDAAERDHAQSIRDVRDARQDEKLATEAVDKAEEDLRRKRVEAKEADDAVLKRIQEVRDAQQEVVDRTTDLKLLEEKHALERREVGIKAAEDIRDAEKLLTKAIEDQTDARRDLNDSVDDYNLAKALLANKADAESIKFMREGLQIIRGIKDAKVREQIATTLYNDMMSRINNPEDVKAGMRRFADQAAASGINITMYPSIDSAGNLQLVTKPATKKAETESDVAYAARLKQSNSGSSSSITRASGQISGRQFGGPVQPGTLYNVNEVRPEFYKNSDGIFAIPGGNQFRTFPKPGTIIPNEKALAKELGAQQSSSGAYTDARQFNFTVSSNASDNENAARRLFELTRREELRSGKGR